MRDPGDSDGSGARDIFCALVDARLSELLVGDLPAAMRRELAPHLECCARCRAELSGFAALVSELGALPVTASAASSWLRIERALELERKTRPLPWFVQVGALVTAALCIAALLVRASPPRWPAPASLQPYLLPALYFLFGTVAALGSLPLLAGARRAGLARCVPAGAP